MLGLVVCFLCCLREVVFWLLDFVCLLGCLNFDELWVEGGWFALDCWFVEFGGLVGTVVL